ncbi:MAG: YfcE family phosphodiesterase [Bacteroidetes bacterium HGW-Bacteroidetes-22]|nr:MAG: YfcE family phosphodiesterase [Bacteroidetes bacterium HGW-Bacteroidetes-22]
MTTIGLISDTHGFLNPRVLAFFVSCDEIWHAGDIGSPTTLHALQAYKPTRAVYGNIDGTEVRHACPETLVFRVEDIRVAMIHIGGYPGRYSAMARKMITEEKPALFVCGHSHILKVIYDKKHEVLTLNPGAAGNSGFHQMVTALRFKIEGDMIFDMEIFEQSRS